MQDTLDTEIWNQVERRDRAVKLRRLYFIRTLWQELESVGIHLDHAPIDHPAVPIRSRVFRKSA